MHLSNCAWPDDAGYLKRSQTVVLPVGCQTHDDPNGLIGTDAITLETVAERAADRRGVRTFPVVPFSVAHLVQQSGALINVHPFSRRSIGAASRTGFTTRGCGKVKAVIRAQMSD